MFLQYSRKAATTAAFQLVLSATLAAGAFVICAASSSPEVTTMSVTSLESSDFYMSTKKVDFETEREKLAGNGEKSIIGDIDKLKKVAEILQTVGETIIPVVIQNNTPNNSDRESIHNKTRGLPLIHGLKKEVDKLAKIKT